MKKHLYVTDLSKQNKINQKFKHFKLLGIYLRQRETKHSA